MPWCEDCAKFWNPSSMTAEGTCPTCGRALERPATPAGDGDEAVPGVDHRTVNVKELAGEDAKAPWHFKLLVGLVVLYLGWRVYQMVAAAVG